MDATVSNEKKDESIANCGLLIAYVIPGCVALWGLGQANPKVGEWFGAASANSATLCGDLLRAVKFFEAADAFVQTGLEAAYRSRKDENDSF